mmetsp:Transcript_55360/g.118048  ORF Transcript_55360/g.118048 Transcript_55360/m.118048 type:complete len:585 (+) Transcript_55360:195-1949(+)
MPLCALLLLLPLLLLDVAAAVAPRPKMVRADGLCTDASTPTVALAMQGGGFRAMAVDTGVIAGILAKVGQDRGILAPTVEDTGILQRFCLLSSNSGSSWFLSELIYSGRFLSLLESMAASPATASSLYAADWTNLWLKATNVEEGDYDEKGRLARKLVKELLGTGDEDTIFVMQYFLASGYEWDDFTALLLNSTGDLTSETQLGGISASWSKGKVWQVAHSAVLPSDDKPGILFQGRFLSLPRVTYEAVRAPGAENMAQFVPATFSVEVGSAVSASAPLRYVAPDIAQNVTALQYKAKVSLLPFQHVATTTALGEDLANGAIVNFSAALPVVEVAAASSAFLGEACTMGDIVAEAEDFIDFDLTPWVSNVTSGNAFKEAEKTVTGFEHFGGVTAGSATSAAMVATRGLVDGGLTDGTGIGQAAAAGASEIVAVLNCNASIDPFYLQLLFAGGPAPSSPGSSKDIFPVFSAPNAGTFLEDFLAFPRLVVPNTTRFLKNFSVGSVNVTTAENGYFGIEGGRAILLHIIQISSDLDIGPWDNLNNFDVLAQEIEMAILHPPNEDLVTKKLLPMFLEQARTATREILV